MSSPFRSEVSQLQEQLRRAEERVSAVENERATLERQLLRGRTHYGWLIVVLAAAVVSGFVGYTLAAAPAAKRQAEADARAARDRAELEVKKVQVVACEASAKASAAEHEACAAALDTEALKRKLVEDLARARARARGPLSEHCPCQPGDPLCSCL